MSTTSSSTQGYTKAYEAQRSRELYKYFKPTQPQPLQHAHSTANTKPVLPNGVDPTCVNPTITASNDGALAAFTLVLANQLNCARSMISLLDSTNQYLVAEATRSTTLYQPHEYASEDDRIWLGGAEIIPRVSGLCVNTLLLSPPEESPNMSLLYEIDDLATDERYKDAPFVTGWPYLRFYTGVPLRTHNHINIGSLCVIDNKPRPGGLTKNERRTMHAMADTVMKYFELVRGRNDMLRERKMSEGLGRFIGTGIDMRSGRTRRSKKRSAKAKARASMEQALPNLEEEAPSNQSEAALPQTLPERPKELASTTAAHEIAAQDGVALPEEMQSGQTMPRSENLDSPFHNTFARAAAVLKEALDVDGFIFIDAEYATSGVAPHSFFDSAETLQDPSKDADQRGYVLGHSGAKYSLHELTKQCVDYCVERYPQGRVFQYGDSAESDSDFDTTMNATTPDMVTSDSSSGGTSAHSVKDTLRRFLCNSRSTVVAPLYSASSTVYAIGFGWTCRRDRIFVNEGETAYLAAFNNSIMAEISRIAILNADRAKGDFIASVSHELRSPLHGILASAEFLQDSELNDVQSSFVRIIESCGRTLLSTINHVLDFGKLNAAGRETTPDEKSGKEQDVDKSACPTDLATITEEVAAVVFASNEYKPALVHTTLGAEADPHDVISIIDIQERAEWTFITHPEAFRRVLLNITGNAFKYTDQGYVKISLAAEDVPGDGPTGETNITLKVTDSGRGISKSFMKDKLFTAFSQENSMVSGAGLGLSIVKHLLATLGGDIKFRSEVGVGTEVTVTMRLPRAKHTAHMKRLPAQLDGTYSVEGPSLSEALLRDAKKRFKNKVVRLLGFKAADDWPESETRGLRLLQDSLHSYLTSWLGMKVILEDDYNGEDIVIANHCPPMMDKLSVGLDGRARSGTSGGSALLILCATPSHFTVYSGKDWQKNVGVLEVRIKPCGPKKIIEALSACFDKVERHQVSSEASTELPSEMALTPGEKQAMQAERRERAGLMSSDPGLPLSPLAHTRSKQQVRSDNSALEHVEQTQPPGQTPGVRLPRVLIVDDNLVNLKLLATYLKRQGYPYEQANNGLEALNTFKGSEAGFEIILMDLQMPVMDGLQSTKAIREVETERQTQSRATVIALTGLSAKEDKSEAFRCGIDLFLVKPISFKNLGQILTDIQAEKQDPVGGEEKGYF